MSIATQDPIYQPVYDDQLRAWYIHYRGSRRWQRQYATEAGANRAIGHLKRRDLESNAEQGKRSEEAMRKLGNQLGIISTVLNRATTPIILPANALEEIEALTGHAATLIRNHPGMLFHCGYLPQAGLSLDKTRLVLVPSSLFRPYRDQCKAEAGYSQEQEEQFYESISYEVEDEQGRTQLVTPDIPNPTERAGEWKARQVAHWLNEEDSTPVLDYAVWANGTWG